jgi:hypothetical protein
MATGRFVSNKNIKPPEMAKNIDSKEIEKSLLFDQREKEVIDAEIKLYIIKIGKPENFGPGEWWRLHEDAYWARTKEEIDIFIKGLPRRFRGLPCPKCRENALKYLSENNPERYRHLKEGMFLWTFEFHNYKNKELGKPTITYEQAILPHRVLEFPDKYTSEACDYCVEKIEDNKESEKDKKNNVKPRSPRVSIIK